VSTVELFTAYHPAIEFSRGQALALNASGQIPAFVARGEKHLFVNLKRVDNRRSADEKTKTYTAATLEQLNLLYSGFKSLENDAPVVHLALELINLFISFFSFCCCRGRDSGCYFSRRRRWTMRWNQRWWLGRSSGNSCCWTMLMGEETRPRHDRLCVVSCVIIVRIRMSGQQIG
jgi:hypothetical protein